MRMDELTAERIFARIESVLNSYQFIKFDETVTLHFVHMKSPQGGKGNTPGRLLSLEQLLTSKRSIVRVKDDGANHPP